MDNNKWLKIVYEIGGEGTFWVIKSSPIITGIQYHIVPYAKFVALPEQ